MKRLYTCFINTYLNENGEWISERVYYAGDHFTRNRDDWRFRVVHNKRCPLQFSKYVYL